MRAQIFPAPLTQLVQGKMIGQASGKVANAWIQTVTGVLGLLSAQLGQEHGNQVPWMEAVAHLGAFPVEADIFQRFLVPP